MLVVVVVIDSGGGSSRVDNILTFFNTCKNGPIQILLLTMGNCFV